MTTQWIADGVLRIATTNRDNAFLIDGADGLTLIDVGWANAPEALRTAFAQHGHPLDDLARIVITHAHPDHVRGLAELRGRTDAEVLIHTADADWLRAGRVPVGGRSAKIGAVLDAIPLLHWRPVTADQELTDGDLIGSELRVLHTPGHSPGHIAVLHEPTRTLLVGDALFHRGEQPELGPAALSHDPGRRTASLKRLPRDIGAIGFAHGAPMIGGEVENFYEWLAAR